MKSTNWMSNLQSVLWMIRQLPNETDHSTPFQLVTGELPQIPSFTYRTYIDVNDDFISDMTKWTQSIQYRPPCPATQPKDLSKATHVWLRTDRVKSPLEAPYTGPYAIITPASRSTIKIETSTGPQTVSLERIKPVKQKLSKTILTSLSTPHLLTQNDETTLTPLPIQTRTGRQVKFKTNNDFFYY